LIAATVENPGDQDVCVVTLVDNVALKDERLNAFAELGPMSTHAGLFDEQLESIEDGVNESIGRRGAGIIGDVGPDLLEVLFGQG
jgi:hypothetical protein